MFCHICWETLADRSITTFWGSTHHKHQKEVVGASEACGTYFSSLATYNLDSWFGRFQLAEIRITHNSFFKNHFVVLPRYCLSRPLGFIKSRNPRDSASFRHGKTNRVSKHGEKFGVFLMILIDESMLLPPPPTLMIGFRSCVLGPSRMDSSDRKNNTDGGFGSDCGKGL